MRRQLIPDPIEHLDFHTKLDAACAAIEAEIITGSYIPRPPIRFLSEKSRGLCRQIVVPSVKDALVLQALSDALWVELRTKAPSKRSFFAPHDHQFSKQIKGHSSEYGPLAAWLAFQETIFGFATSKRYIVVTDIANYYDFISYDHLRNILADLSLAREHALDLLLYTLSCMLWQPDYMPRVAVGLPQMNLDAPRLLAHCFLFEIDALLSSRSGLEFARYMDDIDIGVDTLPEAKLALRDLDLALQTRQIRLNSGKTKIMLASDAVSHFKIRENALIDKLADRVSDAMKSGGSLDKVQLTIQRAIRAGLRKNVFSTGNGEKIFKRLINLSSQAKADLSDELFGHLLRAWPSLRDAALTWWQRSSSPEAKLPMLVSVLQEGIITDDAAIVDIAAAAVAARLPDTAAVRSHLDDIIAAMDAKSVWGFYARCWLLSKYKDAKTLMNLIETSVSLWVTHEHLSRLVAGMFPRMFGTSEEAKFEAIMRRTGNQWSLPVLDFHRNLTSGTNGYTSIKSFVLAPNSSLPNRLSHSKFLMLLSLLKNVDLAPYATAQLRASHARGLSDPFYVQQIP